MGPPMEADRVLQLVEVEKNISPSAIVDALGIPYDTVMLSLKHLVDCHDVEVRGAPDALRVSLAHGGGTATRAGRVGA